MNARCSLACTYCHTEGEARVRSGQGLPLPLLEGLLQVALDQGVRKLKLLGGEPLLRRDLPEVIRAARATASWLDISVITGGAVARARIMAAFDAGLSRMNMSIHGWERAAFCRKAQRPARLWELRQDNLALLLALGRPLKLNYVYSGAADLPDLDALLGWAADKPVVINVLDDLSDPRASHRAVLAALAALRGPHLREHTEHDPDSLPTLRLRWSDGLLVEVKDHPLGAVSPWRTCPRCPHRARCREGIYAWRLGHTGVLRPCMDRTDLRLDLARAYHLGGHSAAAAAWRCFELGMLRRAA